MALANAAKVRAFFSMCQPASVMPSSIISGSSPELERPSLAFRRARAFSAMSSVKTVLVLAAALVAMGAGVAAVR